MAKLKSTAKIYKHNPLAERFWSKVDKSAGPDGCWIWTRCRNIYGYGLFQVNRKTQAKAHRISYEMAQGPIPIGLCVLHQCDVPACVNPSHLFVGTHIENMRDCINKRRRRGGSMKGEAHHQAKLTDTDIQAIVALEGKYTLSHIARHYGVSKTTINRIYIGKSWTHITGR